MKNIAEPQGHVLMMQRESIKKFMGNGDDTQLKRLNKLYEHQALLPRKKEDMLYKGRKNALRCCMFLKKKFDG